ncbi:MAG: hypothetical protein DID91_2727703451 [Candidatus Nitrotoga sp. MKT]|nr:MAG: hypothetical protein DID91_2727703451 [Candidatus Nitrotoga sp. MKT]
MGDPIDAIQHILSKGYRRARNFGFINSKLISLVQLRKPVMLLSQQSRPAICCKYHARRYAVNVVAGK